MIIAEFLRCLSSVNEEKLSSSIKTSPFYAVMIDESTDVAVMKQLVLVIR